MKTYDISDFEKLKVSAKSLYESGKKVFLLKGDLGAGKTTFVSQFIKENLLSSKESFAALGVMSPTFSLINNYQTKDFSILHADLYRMKEQDFEKEELLFQIEDVDFTFIEWPEKLGNISSIFDAVTLTFKLNLENKTRKIVCS